MNMLIKFCRFAPYVVMAIALSVMLGWKIENEFLVTIIPGEVPMQFNTALCFFLFALSAWLCQREHTSLEMVPSIFAGLFAFATVMQYNTGYDFRIDTLFDDPFIANKTVYPGRMAPNTGALFCLLAVALQTIPSRIKDILYVIICTIGGLTVLGYLLGVEPLYAWGEGFTNMALHTGAAFVFMGIAGQACRGFHLSKIPSWRL